MIDFETGRGINIQIFTYSGDKKALEECVRTICNLLPPGVRISIFDDANDPAYPHKQNFCNIGYIRYHKTSFSRNKNLRGRLCFREMVHAMYQESLEVGGFNWVIKLDPDTILTGLTWLKRAVEANVCFTGTVREDDGLGNKPVSGMCYAIRADLLKPMYRLAKNWVGAQKPAQEPVQWDKSYEDVTMASFATILSQPAPILKQAPWSIIPGRENLFTAWNYTQTPNKSLMDVYSKFEVVTFGNHRKHKLDDSIRDQTMKQFVDHLLEKKNA